jgi:hypothetical protein
MQILKQAEELQSKGGEGRLEPKGKNYSTQYSRVVPHHSTDCAITSLTSEIGRDPVLSGVYGRSYFTIVVLDLIWV